MLILFLNEASQTCFMMFCGDCVFGKSCSQKLVENADNFIDTDINPKKFLIREGK